MDRAILADVDLEQKHICKQEPQKLQRWSLVCTAKIALWGQ